MHRKDMIGMVVTILVIVGLFYGASALFFPSKPAPAPTPAANAPADNTPLPPAAGGELRSTTPSTQVATRPTSASEDRGFKAIERAEARTHRLANSRLTAVISERGATIESLSFVDAAGNPVFLRTPSDPVEKPSVALEMLRPLEAAPSLAPLALRLDDNDEWRNTARWELVSGPVDAAGGGQSLTFRFPPSQGFAHSRESDDTILFKTITLRPDTFRLDVELRVENHGDKVADKVVGLWGPVGMTNDGTHTGAEHARVALYGSTEGKRFSDLHEEPAIAHLKDELADINEDRAEEGKPALTSVDNRTLDEMDKEDRFLLAHGLRTQFFLAVLAANPDLRDNRWSGTVLPVGGTAAVSLLAPPLQVPAAKDGKAGEQSTRMSFYVGPRDKEYLEQAWNAPAPQDEELNAQWRDLAPTGWPSMVSAPLHWILRKLTDGVGPGLAIIFLTLIVRMVLSPLSYRGQKSMAVYTQKMKIVKPQLDKIKEKYQGNTERDAQLRMLTETRAAMKEQNVGILPLGGCLPMFIQLPIFIGLYRTFGNAFYLRQANFLWINDLSLPDATIPFSTGLSMGFLSFLTHNGIFTINLLPLVWIGLSLVQMRLQPKPDDPQQAAMQKQMGCIFPLMGLMFYSFASGFAFYFIVSSIYSIAESKLIKRHLIRTGVVQRPLPKDAKAADKPAYHGAK
ncbi:MAG: YidC/Oxa1 family insertase periplasmic-domain containing protein [Planctomycetes bacterium]|nr:YidC/Oxa1 family insertase periplasmic-domain containing protein [Planctomycetota bacterium]